MAVNVKHGERLEIVQRRRRFLKVRTASGAEGWTHERQLLSAEEMAQLRTLTRRAKSLPSQGVASTYDKLNVHTEPSRFSTSFTAINAGEKVEVLEHIVTPRTEVARKPLIPPAPKKAKPAKKPRESRYPPPAPPVPPRLPANWLEISKSAPLADATVVEAVARPVPTDGWTLIRMPAGQAGWVLTRRLFMSIPDEVAQYAEGRRITSYFSLADVSDGDETKHDWLWTTAGGSSYDFDSFRVFIWNVRRHRYETAYIERNLKGFAPVQVHPVELGTGMKKGAVATKATYPGFSVCVEKGDSQRYLRSYAFIVNVVRFAGEQPCTYHRPSEPGAKPGSPAAAGGARQGEAAAHNESLYGRVKERLRGLGKRWFKR